jgi:hypothetical protein
MVVSEISYSDMVIQSVWRNQVHIKCNTTLVSLIFAAYLLLFGNCVYILILLYPYTHSHDLWSGYKGAIRVQ